MNPGGIDTEPTSRRRRWPWRSKPKHLDRQDETGEPARSPKSLLIDLAVLFGLGGMAVTQPLLEPLGANPTFFVAGNYSTGQIVWFAAIVAVVPAVIVFALTAPFSLIGRRCAAASHGAAVFVLAALFGLALTRTLGLDALLVAGALAVALGLAVAVAS